VPFAEYAPALLSAAAPESVQYYARGAARQLPQAGGISFGALVCQEANYPEAGYRPVRAGAALLVSGANDGFVRESPLLARFASAENPWFAQLEYKYARFRAVENGRYLLRSTKIGIAGIVDIRGETVAALADGEKGVRVAAVPLMQGETPYTRTGDAPLLLLCACVAVYGIRRQRLWG